MSSSEPEPGAPRVSKVAQIVAEGAVIAAGLLLVPFITSLEQTSTVFGITVPTVIIAVAFWILGVIGGGIFTFRHR
jgi:hypothetical protein